MIWQCQAVPGKTTEIAIQRSIQICDKSDFGLLGKYAATLRHAKRRTFGFIRGFRLHGVNAAQFSTAVKLRISVWTLFRAERTDQHG